MATIGKDIEKAATLLRAGNLIGLPTETVYGLAGNGLDCVAISAIYATKQRPATNPLILHVASMEMLMRLVSNVSEVAYKIIDAYWPGPLTLLLPKSDLVPACVNAGLPHVAIRFPKHGLCNSLLQILDFPLAAPSANPYTYISPTAAWHVQKMLGGKIPYILDGGVCDVGIESTIVGFDGDTPIIYRKGAISPEEIEALVGRVAVYEGNETLAPGMHKKHYCPTTPVRLVKDIDELKELQAKTKNLGFISLGVNPGFIATSNFISLGNAGATKEAARNIYNAMHQLDDMQLDVMAIMALPEDGVGAALNDRLMRAAELVD